MDAYKSVSGHHCFVVAVFSEIVAGHNILLSSLPTLLVPSVEPHTFIVDILVYLKNESNLAIVFLVVRWDLSLLLDIRGVFWCVSMQVLC